MGRDHEFGRDHQQCVAIRRRPRNRLRRDGCSAARAVFDHDRRPPSAADLIRQQTRHDIGGAGRRIRNNELDGAARLRLSAAEAYQRECKASVSTTVPRIALNVRPAAVSYAAIFTLFEVARPVVDVSATLGGAVQGGFELAGVDTSRQRSELMESPSAFGGQPTEAALLSKARSWVLQLNSEGGARRYLHVLELADVAVKTRRAGGAGRRSITLAYPRLLLLERSESCPWRESRAADLFYRSISAARMLIFFMVSAGSSTRLISPFTSLSTG